MKRIFQIGTIALLSLSASALAEGKKYVIVLHHQNFIPTSVDKAVQDAGGTITTRIPQIGALGVESDNPNFIAEMKANKNVDEVSEDIHFRMIPTPEQMNLQPMSAIEAPGPDTQTGPDPFYNPFQWDKKRIRASNEGSYAVQQGRPDVVVAVLIPARRSCPIPTRISRPTWIALAAVHSLRFRLRAATRIPLRGMTDTDTALTPSAPSVPLSTGSGWLVSRLE